jgi:thiol-disulfide isomerase/thioredoxin
MKSKIKTLFFDLFIGIISLFIVYVVATYINSNESVIELTLAVIFMLAGLIRGKHLHFPSWIRIAFIDIGVVLYLPLTHDLSLATIQYPVIAVLFTIIGFIIGMRWQNIQFMKKIVLITLPLFVLVLISLFILPRYLYYVSTYFNKPAPEFEIYTFDDQIIRSSDLKGKVILVDFWSSNCMPCVAFMPKMEELYLKYRNNSNVAIYCLNPGWESIEKAKSFLEKKNFDLPFTYDRNSKTSNLFGVYSNPSTIIIDRKYNLRIKHIGYSPSKDILTDFTNYIEKFLKQ